MTKISAVIMARNEAHNIAEAIASLGFADEIIVADTGSGDDTIRIACQAGASVHRITFDGYGRSKNRALDLCSHEWVFSLDADERVSPELARSIRSAIERRPEYDGFAVNRLTYFLGKPIRHSGWYPDYVVRLFNKDKGRFKEKLVHESVIIDGRTGRLDGLLYHYSYRDLDNYIEKMNIYSSLNAEDMHRCGKKFSIFKLLSNPPAAFIKMYLLKAGFLDGFHGLLLACLSSFHVFVKYAKLKELDKKSENARSD